MSGYRTLHRIQPPVEESPLPIWRVRFSPCRSSSPPQSSSSHPSSLRLLAAGASNTIQCYSLTDRTNKDANTDDVLDASAMRVERTECLISKDDYNTIVENNQNKSTSSNATSLGYASLDIVRNYCGSDTVSGNEIVAASQLGGKVCIWVRLDPILIDKGVIVSKDQNVPSTTISSGSNDGSSEEGGIRYIQPHSEFTISSATGTTLAIRPPSLANYYSKRETDILVAMGCANGAVVICKTGILTALPGAENASTSSRVVGDTSSASAGGDTIDILDKNSTPGEIVATIGGGHACVLSLAFHPTIPNCFVVGRKDGTIDIYSSATNTDDYYHHNGGKVDLTFRRMHRLVHSSFPIRALSFSEPDGALLFAGDDNGQLYSYDTSCNNVRTNMAAPVKLVACALTAHKGWVMNLTTFPDGKRVATCGSDRTVRVWDCGMGLSSSTPVHSFEGVHDGLVWGIDCGSAVVTSCGGELLRASGEKLKLISCGNDGVMQVFSCGE